MFGWTKVKAQAKIGTLAHGDPAMPPTRWWNHLFLRLFQWRQVTVFEFAPDSASKWFPTMGYMVGYKLNDREDMWGMLCNTILHDTCFRVRNGYENCVFFAIDLDGREMPLRIVKQTTLDDPEYASYRLI